MPTNKSKIKDLMWMCNLLQGNRFCLRPFTVQKAGRVKTILTKYQLSKNKSSKSSCITLNQETFDQINIITASIIDGTK